MQTDTINNFDFSLDSKFDLLTEKVLQFAENFILTKAKTKTQFTLLKTAMAGLRYQVENWLPETQRGRPVLIPFIHLPIFIYAGVHGRIVEKAIQLSAATSLIFLGIDIFDDVADGDCPSHWEHYSVGERNLVAATLLSSLPQLLIADIAAFSQTLHQMQRSLADGLLTMSAGQHGDILSCDNHSLQIKNVIDNVSKKSGAEIGMFARLAAMLALANDTQINLYTQLGTAIGTAGQLSSDCYDLFIDPECRDLLHGTLTLPVVIYLNSLNETDRNTFILLVNEARENNLAREEVKFKVRQSGALGACAIVVESYCQEARKAIKLASPHASVIDNLEAMITDISFFRKTNEFVK